MKLISFNIRSANDPNGHSFDERAPRMKKIIEKYDPDLIGFQEVVPGWMKHIPEDYGEKYEIFHKYRCEPPDKEEGCTILWKKGQFDLLDQGYFWLSDTPNIVSQGWDSRGYHRIAVWVKLREKKTGVEFHFFNTHYGFSDECQMKSAKLILDHFKPLGVRTCFITGDFNMYHYSPAYKYMSRVVRNINELLENDLSPTFHAYDPPSRAHLTPIDFCFVTPQTVEPISYARITDTFDGKFPSDHYGLFIELNVCQAIEMLALDAENLYPEDEKKAGSQVAWLRRAVKLEGGALVTLRNAGSLLKEKIAKDGIYQCAFEDSTAPIYYKEEAFELLQAIPLGEDCGVAVFKHKNTGKHFGLINGGSPAAAKQIKAFAEEQPALPLICSIGGKMRIGDQNYRLLSEGMKEMRLALDPQNTTPTYKGNFADMTDPGICDFAFFRGEGIRPVAYHLSGTVNRKKLCYSGHEQMNFCFTI